MSHIIGDIPLREDGSSIISPSISNTDERRTPYPFKVKPFVEKSFGNFTDRERGEPLKNTWHEIMTPPVLVCTLLSTMIREEQRNHVYLDLRIQLAMNIGNEPVRNHVSAGEALKETYGLTYVLTRGLDCVQLWQVCLFRGVLLEKIVDASYKRVAICPPSFLPSILSKETSLAHIFRSIARGIVPSLLAARVGIFR